MAKQAPSIESALKTNDAASATGKRQTPALAQSASSTPSLRLIENPSELAPSDVLAVQRVAGNRAASRLVQSNAGTNQVQRTKFTIGGEEIEAPSLAEAYKIAANKTGSKPAQQANPPKAATYRVEATAYGTFNVYPDETLALPVAQRKKTGWAIREKEFTELKDLVSKAKAGASGIEVQGTDEFKLAVTIDLAWLMTQGVGRQLVTEIMGSGKKLTIKATAGGNGENAAVFSEGLLKADGTPGPGTDTTVDYNTGEWDPYGEGEAWQKRPPAIGLAHEMIHAWADMKGVTPHKGVGAVPVYERQAVGLQEYETAVMSENKFRAAFGLPLRPRY